MRAARFTSRVAMLVSATAAVLAAVVVPATSGEAATLSCATRTTTKPFTAWGDANSYFLMQSASFESGTTGWTLYKAAAASGNEQWKVRGSSDSQALVLQAGGTATSPQMCVASDEDSLRYFVKRPGVAGAKLNVHIEVTSGVNRATNDLSIDGGVAGWVVADRMMLPDIRDASGQQIISVTFGTSGTAATWSIDDVYVDPWKSL